MNRTRKCGCKTYNNANTAAVRKGITLSYVRILEYCAKHAKAKVDAA